MTSEQLVWVASVLLALGFEYIPGLAGWFEAKVAQVKRLIMLGLLAVTAVGAFGLGCLGQYAGVTCTADGAWGLFWLFIQAIMVNQTVHLITKRPD